MRMHRPVITAAHIIFPGPNQLYRGAAKVFRNRGRFAWHVRIDHGTTAKPTAREFSVKGDLFGLEPEHLTDCHLIHGLELGRDPGFSPIPVEAHSRIQRLHGRVRQVRKLVFGNDAIGVRYLLQSFFIPPRDRHIAGCASELLIPRAEGRAVGPFNSGEVPIDLQSVARLLRGPEPIGDNRDAAPLYQRNLKDIADAVEGPRFFVVDLRDARAKNRRVGHDCDLHSGKSQIQPEFLRAITLRAAVEPFDPPADEPKLRRVFQSHFRRHGLPSGFSRQLSVFRKLLVRTINDARFGATGFRRHPPAISRSGYQHRPRLCSEFAILGKRVRDRT